jgi:hypothetical protein
MHKSIYILAHEDDTGFDVDTSEPITPEEIIDSQADHDEFTETAASAQADVNAIEESNDIVNDTEDVTDSIDEKLEQPETVTADDVMVAQESMRIICHRYGIKPEMVLGHRVSHESASNNPIHALKLSREAGGDFAKTVIDGIRNIFKRLVVTIKKLFAKAAILLSRIDKVATKLVEKLGSYGEAPGDAKFSDSEVMNIVYKLGAVILANGGKLSKDPSAVLGEYISLLQDTKHIAKYSSVLKNSFTRYANILKNDAEIAEKFSEATMRTMYTKLSNNTEEQILKKVVTAAASGKFHTIDHENINFIPYAITGVKVRAFVLERNNYLKSVTLNANSTALKTITVDVPSKTSIIKLLGSVVTIAKKAKEYEAAALKETNDADTLLANLAKETTKSELTPEDKRSVTSYSSAIRVVIANLCVDSILAQVSGTKAILGYCNTAARTLTKPDKDKK